MIMTDLQSRLEKTNSHGGEGELLRTLGQRGQSELETVCQQVSSIKVKKGQAAAGSNFC